MAATSDRVLDLLAIHVRVLNSCPVAASTKIYQNTFVGLSSGYARGLVAGDKCIGLATRQFDNSSGSAAAINAEVMTGVDVEHAVTGVTGVGDRDKLVYASDDQTLTLTAEGNSLVGIIRQHVTSTTCLVHIFSEAERAAF